MIKIQVAIRTPRLTAIRKVIEDTKMVNEEICRHFLSEYDRNIVEGGIWEKFPSNKESTRVKREYEGKSPIPMFGLRGKLKYTTGRTQFTFYTDDPHVILMHYKPKKRSWTIAAKNKPLIAFPYAKIGGTGGRLRPGSPYLWFVGKQVKHKGWERRILFPPVVEISAYARGMIAQKIREAG